MAEGGFGLECGAFHGMRVAHSSRGDLGRAAAGTWGGPPRLRLAVLALTPSTEVRYVRGAWTQRLLNKGMIDCCLKNTYSWGKSGADSISVLCVPTKCLSYLDFNGDHNGWVTSKIASSVSLHLERKIPGRIVRTHCDYSKQADKAQFSAFLLEAFLKTDSSDSNSRPFQEGGDSVRSSLLTSRRPWDLPAAWGALELQLLSPSRHSCSSGGDPWMMFGASVDITGDESHISEYNLSVFKEPPVQTPVGALGHAGPRIQALCEVVHRATWLIHSSRVVTVILWDFNESLPTHYPWVPEQKDPPMPKSHQGPTDGYTWDPPTIMAPDTRNYLLQ
ncbi:hypothetical protein PANDA_019045 [Ailuropoda melanoleuca]|uniref:Uncharacterized protein n=1 Tax=Ailuropoda melanoleuca TaxID=9646 RepID=D2I198_AILME|nr:hypothetical protein PANDA_019045 [Ailuropoda melanoleuca]